MVYRVQGARAKALGIGLILVGLAAGGCGRQVGQDAPRDLSGRPIRVVATTSMIADLVRIVGGERVEVTGLMGPGVDPHLYKASEGAVATMAGADVVFYNGLHLEGKMAEVFEQMQGRGVRTVAVADGLPDSLLIASKAFSGNHDPHIWFDVSLWKRAAGYVGQRLAEMDPVHASGYDARAEAYLRELDALDAYVREQGARLPEARRILVTSHDAFGYFGRAYGFDVRGLQGISTSAEAGTADVQRLAEMVARERIPALFIESSVSPRGIEAVRAAARARGHEVRIGGTLFGDALGNPGTPEGTYVGMVRRNIETIVTALAEGPA